MIYVLLGMHKSGTTLVSELLHRSGIRMGDGADVEGDYDGGVFFERSDVRDLNQAILGFGDPAYVHPAPREIRATDAQRARMREIIAANEARGGDWGFKDPRTCLTYPIWREELPPHRIVGVARSLPEVLSHYRRKDPGPALTWRVARTWCDYNAGLLAALEKTPDSVLVDYHALMTTPDELPRLAAFVGRPIPDVRNEARHRSRPVPSRRLQLVGALRGVLGLRDADEISAALAEHRARERSRSAA